MLSFVNFKSGSKGNSTLISNGKTNVIIDLGITKRCLTHELAALNLTLDNIDGVLFTHEHTDHLLPLSIGIFKNDKLYATQYTIKTITYNTVNYFLPFIIGSLKITPLETSHDAINPCGYLIEDTLSNESLVYLTDTGIIFEHLGEYILNRTYYILESNHNRKLLALNPNYPLFLKDRIMGDCGHLSNKEAALVLFKYTGDQTKLVALAHLSEENNSAEQALLDHAMFYFKMTKKKTFPYKLICLKQSETTNSAYL
ncbi:MAG: MBL fold metallo-hydrolase [Erysipelotrichaceae bacterium]|jgi:phosphoribosyl 1,2-cyclic phosphodiesterase|nr:MBL fold metallo-hydrolase [Erysipelotrichaceae bacterium]